MSLHARRKHPDKLQERQEQQKSKPRLRFRSQGGLTEVHFIVNAPPAYHYSLDGFLDEEVLETWQPEEMTVKELKIALKSRNLSCSGTKKELAERLRAVIEPEREERKRRLAERKQRMEGLDKVRKERLRRKGILPDEEAEEKSREGAQSETSSTTRKRKRKEKGPEELQQFFAMLEADQQKQKQEKMVATPPTDAASKPEEVSAANTELASASGRVLRPRRQRRIFSASNNETPTITMTAASSSSSVDTKRPTKKPRSSSPAPSPPVSPSSSPMRPQSKKILQHLLSYPTQRLLFFPPQLPAGNEEEEEDEDEEEEQPTTEKTSTTATATEPPPPLLPPSGIPPAASNGPAAKGKRPLKGVLKQRKEKSPEEMSRKELCEHLIAFGVTSPASGKRKQALVQMLRQAMAGHLGGTTGK